MVGGGGENSWGGAMLVLPHPLSSIDCRSYLQNLKFIVRLSTKQEVTFNTHHICFNFEVVPGHFEACVWNQNAINYFHPGNAMGCRNIFVVSKRLSLPVCSLKTRTFSIYYKFCLNFFLRLGHNEVTQFVTSSLSYQTQFSVCMYEVAQIRQT